MSAKVQIKGIREGLLVTLGEGEWPELRTALIELVSEQREFLRGGRLYLDVGNDFRIGVIDHHSLAAHSGSAARLVLRHPELIQQAVQPALLDRHPLTIVLHEHPDLDCIASAYLATTLLATGDFPAGAEALAAFEKSLALSPDQPSVRAKIEELKKRK